MLTGMRREDNKDVLYTIMSDKHKLKIPTNYFGFYCRSIVLTNVCEFFWCNCNARTN